MYRRYMSGHDINARDLQRGSAEMLVMALLEDRQRHGYEIAQLIEQRSDGEIRFQVPSLYPLLYRLERRGLVEGRWVEKAGERRRRFYRLTAEGKKALAAQRRGWKSLFEALDRVAGFRQVLE
jgi:PadR family transcriptional regulator PadR